jgi:hypothetical protein
LRHNKVCRDAIRHDSHLGPLTQKSLVLQVSDGKNSNLIKALRGQQPFDGTDPPQMPDGFDSVPDSQIDQNEQWIDAGCP